MRETRVRVKRQRPTALTWSVALAATMLAVYALTWTAAGARSRGWANAGPRVTEQLSLEGLEGWCVTLGAYPDAARARVAASEDADRGSAGRVYEAEGAWRVLGALYASERQAQGFARSMAEAGRTEAGVLKLSIQPAALRVTAPRDRIASIVAADGLLREQALQLSDMAAQVDRGALQPESARALCALKATEAERLAAQMRQPGAAKTEGLEAALAGAVDALARALGDLAASPPRAAATLSGALRLAGIDAFIALGDIRDRLVNGA